MAEPTLAEIDPADPVGVFYCIAHEGVALEDDGICDFKQMDEAFVMSATRPEPCDFRRCFIDRRPEAQVTR